MANYPYSFEQDFHYCWTDKHVGLSYIWVPFTSRQYLGEDIWVPWLASPPGICLLPPFS